MVMPSACLSGSGFAADADTTAAATITRNSINGFMSTTWLRMAGRASVSGIRASRGEFQEAQSRERWGPSPTDGQAVRLTALRFLSGAVRILTVVGFRLRDWIIEATHWWHTQRHAN